MTRRFFLGTNDRASRAGAILRNEGRACAVVGAALYVRTGDPVSVAFLSEWCAK